MHLQARKLGVWEGFQPGDFQQDLVENRGPFCNTADGNGGEIAVFTLCCSGYQREWGGEDLKPTQEETMRVFRLKRDDGTT